MADFNAGSIESQLEVDRSPFTQGLELAKEQAERFEEDTHPTINIDVDNGDALIGFDDVELRADELDGRDVNIHVDVDNDEADRKLDETRNKVDGGNGRGGLLAAFGAIGSPTGVLKPLLVGGAVSAALGALPGILGAATGAALGLGGALTIAGAGLGAFGLIAKSDFTDMQATLKDLTKQQQALNNATTDAQRQTALKAIAADTAALQGPAGQAAKAYQTLHDALGQLKADTAPAVFGVMSQFFSLAASVLPKVEPLINATATALGGIGTQLATAFSGPGFSKFIAFLTSEVGPVLGSLADSLGKFGGGFAAALEKSGPLIDLVLKGLNGFATAFEAITNAPGFDKFIATLADDMPLIGSVLSNVGTALLQIFTALAPSVGPAVDLINLLVTAVGQLAPLLGPLVAGFITFLTDALTPIVPILLDLVTDLVPPLVGLLQDIAPIVPLVAQAFADLVKAFLPLVPVIGELVKDSLPPFINFIEILIKQGVVPLAQQLATSLVPLLPKFADAFDRILKAITPLIPILTNVIIKMIQQMAPQLPGLVKSVADLAISFLGIVEALPPSFWLLLFQMMNLLSNPIVIAAIEDLAKIITKVADAVSALIRGVKEGYEDVRKFFSDLGGNIRKFVTDAPGWLVDTGKHIIEGLFSGIITAWNTSVSFFANLGQIMKNAIGDAGSFLYSVGYNIVHGLWNGISDLGGWLYNRVANFVKDNVKNAATSFLGIFSPSRVMADDVGKYIPMGLAAGIDEHAHTVTDSMNKLSSRVTDTKFGNAGTLKAVGSSAGAQLASANEQINVMTTLVAQLAELVNATKDLPDATGSAVKDHLKPVLDQQTVQAHMYSKQRTLQGSVIGDGS